MYILLQQLVQKNILVLMLLNRLVQYIPGFIHRSSSILTFGCATVPQIHQKLSCKSKKAMKSMLCTINCAWGRALATCHFNVCLCRSLMKYYSTHPTPINNFFQCTVLNCAEPFVTPIFFKRWRLWPSIQNQNKWNHRTDSHLPETKGT